MNPGDTTGSRSVGEGAYAKSGIDEIDTRILRLLQLDGRLTNLKLAELTGLPPRETHKRMKRLSGEGYILGYEAMINPDGLNPGIVIFVRVWLDKAALHIGRAFRAAVQSLPEVLECHEVSGDCSYLMKVRCTDINEYRCVLASKICAMPGVREARTFTVIEEVKSTSLLPI